MRVFLLAPLQGYVDGIVRPLSNTDFPAGYGYLAGALQAAGHEVIGGNLNLARPWSSAAEAISAEIPRVLSETQPQLIGLGGLCTDFQFLRAALKLVRKCAPHVPIVLGGGIINHDAAFIMEALRPDFCIVNDGETAIVELARELADGGNFAGVSNLGWWKDGALQLNRAASPVDLDLLPFPAYEPFGMRRMLDDFALGARYLYRYPRLHPRPMTVVAARDCPFSCTFCVHERSLPYRVRSVPNLIAELRHFYEQYEFNLLLILDELFAANTRRLREFSEAVIEGRERWGWDFSWNFQTHASARLDLETLKLARAAGCYFFSYGIESASPRVLASMNKRSKPAQIAEAIGLAREANVGFGGNFIFGDPAETEQTISESLRFMQEHCRDIHVFADEVHPYPGSKLFAQCLERGIIPNKAQFYESIDQLLYNMTSLPHELWGKFLEVINRLRQFPYVTAVAPQAIAREDGAWGVLRSDGAVECVWKVSADCPFCGERVSYRTPVHEKNAGVNGAVVLTGCPSCNRRFRIVVSAEQAQRMNGDGSLSHTPARER